MLCSFWNGGVNAARTTPSYTRFQKGTDADPNETHPKVLLQEILTMLLLRH